MGIRIKFLNDLNIFGNSRGASASVFAPPTGGGGGFPAYGTVLYTEYGYEYSVGSETYSSILATFVKNQICDVDVVADGVGGSFVDWVSAGNIQYKPYGTVVANDTTPWASGSVEVPTGSYNFITSGEYNGGKNEIHDGFGSLIFEGVGTFVPYSYNLYTGFSNNVDNFTQCPPASGNYVNNGTGMSYPYLWNGTGGYYESGTGSAYGSYISYGVEVDSALRYNYIDYTTEVPSGSAQYFNNGLIEQWTYFWDGYGGVYSNTSPASPVGSYYSYGNYIYDDGTGYFYYWDGFGGYYQEFNP